MLKFKLFPVLIIALSLLAGCRWDHSMDPPDFKAYEYNPILSPGEPGAWDDLFLWSPQVIHDKDTFFLFYLGGNVNGRMAIGLATSLDGYNFAKYGGNPIISPDNEGFDAYTVGPGIILKTDSAWLMYYNAQDIAGFSPGRTAGRASALSPAGPWVKSREPIIRSGSTGEWDAGFIIPSSVVLKEDGSYMMFYSGGSDIARFKDFYIGMATSPDGIIWTKYNDPMTSQHPFAESDPVIMPGKSGEWDGGFIWMANVSMTPEGFRMFYSAAGTNSREELKAFGYAVSKDGIHWKKYSGNPVYRSEDDPFIYSAGKIGIMENPDLLELDTFCFLYYECGPFTYEQCFIGMADGRY